MDAPGPALAMLDVGDVPPALLALDALAKEALVEVIGRGTMQPGRYAILFAGEVEAVERSFYKAHSAIENPTTMDVHLAPPVGTGQRTSQCARQTENTFGPFQAMLLHPILVVACIMWKILICLQVQPNCPVKTTMSVWYRQLRLTLRK